MKSTVAGIGWLVPAGAAVMGSIALSLVVLHPPPAGLLPGAGTAPADREHIGAALVLPAPHGARSRANTQEETLRPAPTTQVAATAPRPAAHPAPSATPHATPPPPPTQTTPPPVTEPVTTPVTPPVTTPVTPPVTTPVTTPSATTPRSHTNNGRWKSQKAQTWKAAASKQNTRTQKGKPPWAGQGNDHSATTTTPPAAAPDTSKKTPPGQAKKTPPGQSKTPPGQAKAPPGQNPAPPEQTQTPPEQTATPPGQDKTPPGQGKKGQSSPS